MSSGLRLNGLSALVHRMRLRHDVFMAKEAAQEKSERLAQALRENLRRRKAPKAAEDNKSNSDVPQEKSPGESTKI